MNRRTLACLAASAWAILIATAEARIFTDNQRREIDAELIAAEDEEATIRMTDGREFTLPLSQFSEEDQVFIKQWTEERLAKLAEMAPKAGETLKFEFPYLPKDFRGNPAAFSAKVPSTYAPDKPIPLMIFLGGGTGNNSPGGALGLTKDDFVCVGLPYPDNGRNPIQHNMVGDFDKVWEYWRPMLAKLEEAIPNLDPELRVIGGFSNGGHAIDGLLAEEEFAHFFTAFFLIDGGGALPSRYRNVSGKHCYVAWGAKSPAARSSGEVVSRARRARMEVVASPMEDTGHAFPGSEKEKVKEWLYSVVIPGSAPAE